MSVIRLSKINLYCNVRMCNTHEKLMDINRNVLKQIKHATGSVLMYSTESNKILFQLVTIISINISKEETVRDWLYRSSISFI